MRNDPPICTETGCQRQGRVRGLCNSHYGKEYRLTHKAGRKYAGYLFTTTHGHVLADSRGRVATHRLVLFDKIGYGPHLCHWCKRHINWRGDGFYNRLAADHLDGNVKNNDPSNLVPSCLICNRHRKF